MSRVAHQALKCYFWFSVYIDSVEIVEKHEKSRLTADQPSSSQPTASNDWASTPDNPTRSSLVDDPYVNQLLFRLYEKVTFEGALAIRYPDHSKLLSYLRAIDDERLHRDFRRNPSLDLGGYDLTAFRKFFAALVAFAQVMSGCAERGRKAVV